MSNEQVLFFPFACIVWTTCQRLRRAEVLHFPQGWVPVKGVSWCLLPLANYVKHYLIPAANFWDWLLPSPTVLSASSFTMNAKINPPRWQFLTLWHQHCCQFVNNWLSFHTLHHWKRERSECISRGLIGFVHYLNKALINCALYAICPSIWFICLISSTLMLSESLAANHWFVETFYEPRGHTGSTDLNRRVVEVFQ